VGQHSGFSGSRSSNYQKCSTAVLNRLLLLRIQPNQQVIRVRIIKNL